MKRKKEKFIGESEKIRKIKKRKFYPCFCVKSTNSQVILIKAESEYKIQVKQTLTFYFL